MAEKKKKKEETCKYEFGSWVGRCGRELYDETHCIFHSEDIEGKREEFEKAFWQEFARQRDEERGYDFRGFVFTGFISFDKQKFDKNVDFSKARFHGEAAFIYAEFSGKVDFRSAQFSRGASFNAAQFSEAAYFSRSRFSEAAEFYGVCFDRKADFTAVQFSGAAVFCELDGIFPAARFSREAVFVEAQFSQKADFGQAQFSGEANFSEAHFSGKADFKGAQFSGMVNFYYARFSGVTLSGLFAALRNGVIKKLLLRGRYKIKDFRFHMSETIAREYPVIDRMTKDDWYLDDYKKNHPVIYFFWWLLADCGRSFLRWAFWSLLFAFGFASKYILVYSENPMAFIFASQPESIITFFYYSVVTFTTLGFGDVVPATEPLKVWVMAEVIMGYIMLGGLISILANKLARRS